jgi:cytochrome P450
MFWTVYYILKNEKIKKKIQEEIEEYEKNDYEISYLNNMKYFDQIINETLRITSGTSSISIF